MPPQSPRAPSACVQQAARWVPAALTVTVAGTSAVLPAARRRKVLVVIEAAFIALLNVAVTVVLSGTPVAPGAGARSEEHTSELQSRLHLVCRLLLEKKKNHNNHSVRNHYTSMLSAARADEDS